MRTRIRHKDMRQLTPNTPARDVGEEQTSRGRYFEADCLAADAVGDFVRISGAPVSGFFQVSKVDITDPSHTPTAGIITEKATSTRCFVVRFGLVDVSSFPSPPTLVPQGKQWIGLDSRLSASVPASGITQLIGHALSATEFLILEGSPPFDVKDGDHRGLDQLVHGIAENSFEEYTYAGNKITDIIVWETVAKSKRIRDHVFSYTGNKITTIVTRQYDGLGVIIPGETMTEAFTHSGPRVTDITRVLT